MTLDELKREALAARPDLLAARSGVKLAQDTQALAFSNRARDITGGVEYDRAGSLNALGFSSRSNSRSTTATRAISPAARWPSGRRRRRRGSPPARSSPTSSTPTPTFQASEKVVSLYQSGYLDQAKQSLDITTYVYQRGNGTLLDLLDAERTYRTTQLAYRQALAAYMTSVEQINFAVGKQVMQ